MSSKKPKNKPGGKHLQVKVRESTSNKEKSIKMSSILTKPRTLVQELEAEEASKEKKRIGDSAHTGEHQFDPSNYGVYNFEDDYYDGDGTDEADHVAIVENEKLELQKKRDAKARKATIQIMTEFELKKQQRVKFAKSDNKDNDVTEKNNVKKDGKNDKVKSGDEESDKDANKEEDDVKSTNNPNVLSQDDVNKTLIALSNKRWEGLNKHGLVGAVAKVIKSYPNSQLLLNSETNEAQINFAKLVWNEGNSEVRKLMSSTSSSWFMTLATNEKMIPLLTASLDAYTKNISSGKASGSDYADIVTKVAAARRKINEFKENVYADAPTKGEVRMVEKFDAKAAEKVDREEREEHHPNESAVTYPFILGKIMIMAGIDFDQEIADIKKVMDDIFKYIARHGQKTLSLLKSIAASHSMILGPKSQTNVSPLLENLLSNSEFITGSGDSEDNKFIPNSAVTLKRIIRLIYMCTVYKTVWGLMQIRKDNFIDNILLLYELESRVKSPDMNSMSMIWYLCIERSNICSIMVDHWELSASNKLAKLLGADTQNSFAEPAHVFPLSKDIKEDFGKADITGLTAL